MKLRFLVLILMIVPSLIFAEDSSLYQNQTIARIISDYKPKSNKAIFLKEKKFKVRVVYAESGRRIDNNKKQFISKWVKSNNNASKYSSGISSEILVFEGKSPYWLPILQSVQNSFWADHGKFPTYIDAYVSLIGFIDKKPLLILSRYEISR